jgi:transposase
MENEQPETLPFAPETMSLVAVNGRCMVQEVEGMKTVLVAGIPVCHYASGDAAAEALWMVHGVEGGWAKPTELVSALDVSRVTVYRIRRRYESGGIQGLVAQKKGPKGPRVGTEREAAIRKFHKKGKSASEMGRLLGISCPTVTSAMRRMGLQVAAPRGRQERLPLGTDVQVEVSTAVAAVADAVVISVPVTEQAPDQAPVQVEPTPAPTTLDTDPTDRSVDRALAAMGLIQDAAPLFAPGLAVPKAGVLLAMPVLVASGVFASAKESLSNLGPAFYGLRTTLVVLLSLALLRVKHPENLKEYSPAELGRVLGLDRAPEVKTLRRKLTHLSGSGEWVDEFLGDLVKRRVAAREEALGYLYVDGHVRVYHGKTDLPKAHAARMRLSVPATQELWVNDADGQPLFFVTQEAHPQLVSALPDVLKQVRELVGDDRRVTVVFDRGGWSPQLFKKMDALGFDVLTYRKGETDPVPEDAFTEHEVPGTAGKARMRLHDALVTVTGGFRMRQVTRLKDRHQTHIVTTRTDLSAVEVAVRMFDRWRQENFFKYMRQEYAIDALVEYGTEADDATRLVPNPARKAVEKDLRKAKAEVARLEASLGAAAMDNQESLHPTMRGFKIATGTEIGIPLRQARELVARLVEQRAALPERVPVGSVKTDVVRLKARRKRLSDGLKMLAYQAESDLAAQIAPFYARSLDEGRRLVLAALQSAADIEVADGELRVILAPQSSPHRSRALAELCRVLDDTATRFPGTTLRLRYAVRQPAAG